MSELIYNAIRTPDGTILQSVHRHDYRVYKDKNGKEYMVDGGLDYLRRGGTGNDAEELSLYDDQPHVIQRGVLTWGSRGKKGDQPLVYKRICDMETSHIEAVLDECQPRDVIKECLRRELEYRKKGDIDGSL